MFKELLRNWQTKNILHKRVGKYCDKNNINPSGEKMSSLVNHLSTKSFCYLHASDVHVTEATVPYFEG